MTDPRDPNNLPPPEHPEPPLPLPHEPVGQPAPERPTLGITMGDPGGIGAEVIVKALHDPEIRKLARFVIFGLNEVLAYSADLAEIEPFWWRDQHERFAGRYEQDVVCLDYDEFSVLGLNDHQPTRAGGQASFHFVSDATQAALRKKVDAIVTAPISKEAWKLAGFDRWPGHTELLAEKTKAKRFAMMFAALPQDSRFRAAGPAGLASLIPNYKGLRVVLATIHEPLFDLRNIMKIGTIFDPIDLADKALREWFGIEKPRIAVCGINPHAGENGHIGDDEKRIVEPAIQMARAAGIDAHGPFPGDTIFVKAAQGQYDLVVAMYHDQGLIPVKLLDMSGTVNLTLGLPIIRTSPDHGTAYDIVGKNKADPGSMKAAIVMACDIVKQQRLRGEQKPQL